MTSQMKRQRRVRFLILAGCALFFVSFSGYLYHRILGEVLYVQGKKLTDQRLYNISTESYKKSIAHNRWDGRAWFRLGTSLSLAGQIELYRDTSRLIDTEDNRIRHSGYLEEAMRVFTIARSSFTFPELYYSLGSVAGILNYTDIAIENYEKTLAILPNFQNQYSSADTFRTLHIFYLKEGWKAYHNGKKDKAEILFRKLMLNDFDHNLAGIGSEEKKQYRKIAETTGASPLLSYLLLVIALKEGEDKLNSQNRMLQELSLSAYKLLADRSILLTDDDAYGAYQKEGDIDYQIKNRRYHLFRNTMGEAFLAVLRNRKTGRGKTETFRNFAHFYPLLNMFVWKEAFTLLLQEVNSSGEKEPMLAKRLPLLEKAANHARNPKLAYAMLINALNLQKEKEHALSLVLQRKDLHTNYKNYFEKLIKQNQSSARLNRETYRIFGIADDYRKKGDFAQAAEMYMNVLNFFTDAPPDLTRQCFIRLIEMARLKGKDKADIRELLLLQDEYFPEQEGKGIRLWFSEKEKENLIKNIIKYVILS